MTKVNREWETEIRKNTWNTEKGLMTKNIIKNSLGEKVGHFPSQVTVEMVISLISTLLSQTRNNLLREIMEEMPKKGNVEYYKLHEQERYIMRIQNQLIDQVNTILESKLSTVKK